MHWGRYAFPQYALFCFCNRKNIHICACYITKKKMPKPPSKREWQRYHSIPGMANFPGSSVRVLAKWWQGHHFATQTKYLPHGCVITLAPSITKEERHKNRVFVLRQSKMLHTVQKLGEGVTVCWRKVAVDKHMSPAQHYRSWPNWHLGLSIFYCTYLAPSLCPEA